MYRRTKKFESLVKCGANTYCWTVIYKDEIVVKIIEEVHEI